MLQDRSREVDEFFNRVLTTQLFAPSNDSLGQTLITHNIQHGCEHAISSYRQYQEFCHDLFGVFSEFASLNSGRRLQDLYGHRGFREGIDLWVGAMAESKMNGSNLDPIFACIIGKTFADVRDGDRFFWENPGVFTEDQQNSLSNIRLSKVICDNADDITTIIPKAFETGQEEQGCESLLILDLNLWKDDSCIH